MCEDTCLEVISTYCDNGFCVCKDGYEPNDTGTDCVSIIIGTFEYINNYHLAKFQERKGTFKLSRIPFYRQKK